MTNSVNAELESLTIALIGSFNPGIFQPAWFAAQKLISDDEAEKATIHLITSDVAVFSLGWASVSVEKDKFVVECLQPPFYEATRDLVLGTFRVLRHTPANMLGINRTCHFQIEGREEMLRLGHLLAPKEYWTGVLTNPLLRKMVMLSERTDGKKGAVNVTIEPSLRVNSGVFIQVNDHFENKEEQDITALTSVLNAVFQESLARSETIMQHVLAFRNESHS